jgi:2-polyprenyl-3-methyl-5-hydroxy-6-metoxy-1,4-benzoquinol methylase
VLKEKKTVEKLKCPVCGMWKKEMISKVFDTETSARYRCRTCEAIFFPNPPDTTNLYTENYNKEFLRPCDLQKAGIMARKLTEILRTFQKKTRMLEIGAGNGLTSLLVKKAGYDVDIIEIDIGHAAWLRKNVIDSVYPANIHEIKKWGTYELIYSSHTIEHVVNPHEFVQGCADRLSKGGMLYLDTPCVEFIYHQGKDWHHFNTRNEFEHVILYSEAALRHILRKAGLKIMMLDKFPEYASMQVAAWKE